MKNNITLEVTVDYINMQGTSIWPDVQKRIDTYNVQNGQKPGRTFIFFELEMTCPVTQKKIRNAIDVKSIDSVGYAPYQEVENECATDTVSVKDSNVIIEMNGTEEAKETSKFIDPDDDIVYRAFKSDDGNEYEDYRLGELVGHGSFE